MTRSHIALTPVLLACLTLSACSANEAPTGAPAAPAGGPSVRGTGEVEPFKDDTDVPLTKQLSQSQITQAIPDAEDVVPDYYPGSLHKRSPGDPDDCSPRNGPAPAGWQRSGRGKYDYQGSTVSREIDLHVCQFDNAEHARTAYDQWQEKEETTPVTVPRPVGEESLFITYAGSSGTVYGYSRSGTVIVRVRVQDAGEDPTDAHDVLAATITRLQQVQAGRRATTTASDIAAAERARR
ncbi:hypothetical protein [Streptomyces sp. TBY4]|uniref:hypothetical protein n=1 Tax=Streptomyces sp. TBY4 TaxID=2962030 RepID=UPI0020B7550B|nr:hypothetical protein [Streptomyces sp. TBY4]MCP3758322.1 hypothetical protein [Streptomyces sp. TBY4]